MITSGTKGFNIGDKSLLLRTHGQKIISNNCVENQIIYTGSDACFKAGFNFLDPNKANATRVRIIFDNIMIRLDTAGAIGYDMQGFSHCTWNHPVIQLRAWKQKGFHGAAESGHSPYHNVIYQPVIQGDFEVAKNPITGIVEFIDPTTKKPNESVAINFENSHWSLDPRRQGEAPNANIIIGGRITGCKYGWIDIGIGNSMFGTTFESCLNHIKIGCPVSSVLKKGQTGNTVIIGTYHHGVLGQATFLIVEETATNVRWMPGCITGYKTILDDRGVRTSVFFGSGLPDTARIGGLFDFTSPTRFQSDTRINGYLTLGDYYLWVDSNGVLRIKKDRPTSKTDGTIVGTQS